MKEKYKPSPNVVRLISDPLENASYFSVIFNKVKQKIKREKYIYSYTRGLVEQCNGMYLGELVVIFNFLRYIGVSERRIKKIYSKIKNVKKSKLK